jgi:hypothetical protein
VAVFSQGCNDGGAKQHVFVVTGISSGKNLSEVLPGDHLFFLSVSRSDGKISARHFWEDASGS